MVFILKFRIVLNTTVMYAWKKELKKNMACEKIHI